jgi:hypothetical protein
MTNVDLNLGRSRSEGGACPRRVSGYWYVLCTIIGVGYLLAGCGGNNSSRSVGLTKDSIRRANHVCVQYRTHLDSVGGPTNISQGSYSRRFVVQRRNELAMLRAVMTSAGGLPAVTEYLLDIGAEYGWLGAVMTDLKLGDVPLSSSFVKESHRIYLKLAKDERALGLTACFAKSDRRGISSSEGFRLG